LGQFAGPYSARQYGQIVFTANTDGSPPNTTHAAITNGNPSTETIDFGSGPHVLLLSVQFGADQIRSVKHAINTDPSSLTCLQDLISCRLSDRRCVRRPKFGSVLCLYQTLTTNSGIALQLLRLRPGLDFLNELTDDIHRKMLWEWGLVRLVEVPISGFANLGLYDQNAQQDFQGEKVGDFPLPTTYDDGVTAVPHNLSHADFKNELGLHSTNVERRRLLRRCAIKTASAHLHVNKNDVRVTIRYVSSKSQNPSIPNVTQLVRMRSDDTQDVGDVRIRDFEYMNMHADAALITVQINEMWHFIDDIPIAPLSGKFAGGNIRQLATHLAATTIQLFGEGSITECTNRSYKSNLVAGVDFTALCVAPYQKCYATPQLLVGSNGQPREPVEIVPGVRAQCLGRIGMFECRSTNSESDARCVLARNGLWLLHCAPRPIYFSDLDNNNEHV
jgi:hypothetical protein